MKISAIATALLVIAPGSQAALRSKENKSTNSKAQIVIQGVLHDFSGKDLAIINDSARVAFNGLQKDSRYSLDEVKPLMHFGAGEDKNLEQCHYCPPDDDTFVNQCHYCPPDDDALVTTKKAGFEKILLADIKVSSKQCHYCPPDDDALELESGANHKAFVKSFCNLLATSGSANLANAHHCSFSFLGATAHKVAPLSVVKRSATKEDGEAALGFLSITGLIHNLSDKDMAVIEKEALETYNKAFVGSTVSSIHVRSGVATPKVGSKQCHYCPPDDDAVAELTQCHYCPPDDDAVAGVTQCHYCPPDDDTFSSKTIGNVLFLDIKMASDEAKVEQCHYCPPDDDALEGVDMKAMAASFSKALCSKLRNSGKPNLAFADDCGLDFFFEHGEASA